MLRNLETGDCEVQTFPEGKWTEFIPQIKLFPVFFINARVANKAAKFVPSLVVSWMSWLHTPSLLWVTILLLASPDGVAWC